MLLHEDTYTCDLPKATQEIAQKELNETNKLRKKALADVRKWIKSQSHIRRTRLDSNFLLRFLRMQKFDIKASCEILEKYLTMRGQYPSWFQNLDCRVRNQSVITYFSVMSLRAGFSTAHKHVIQLQSYFLYTILFSFIKNL